MNKVWCVWVYDCRIADQTKPAIWTNEEAAWRDVGGAIVDNQDGFRSNRIQMITLLKQHKYAEAMHLFNSTSGDVDIHIEEKEVWTACEHPNLEVLSQ